MVPFGIKSDNFSRLVHLLYGWAKRSRPNVRSRVEHIHSPLLEAHERGAFEDQWALLVNTVE